MIERENMNKQERVNLNTICLIEASFKSESLIRSTELLHEHLTRAYWLDQKINELKIIPIKYLWQRKMHL